MNLRPKSREGRGRALRMLGGIHAATVCPMNDRYELDERALEDHLTHVGRHHGIRGLLVNGHAGENAQLTRDDKRTVTAAARRILGADRFLTSGVYSEDTATAELHARDAEEAGADAILVFPPNAWALGQDPDTVIAYHEAIARAISLPILIYQAPVMAAEMHYPVSTIARLATLPGSVGIKEGSWETAAYEETRLAAKAARPDIAVLGSGDEHLLATYLLGTEGSQVSLASIIPEKIVALWDAARSERWQDAVAIHRQIYPLATAIYRDPPAFRATTRVKACLKILGVIGSDAVRPPSLPLPRTEYAALEAALRQCM